jgi:hypothetical protein
MRREGNQVDDSTQSENAQPYEQNAGQPGASRDSVERLDGAGPAKQNSNGSEPKAARQHKDRRT